MRPAISWCQVPGGDPATLDGDGRSTRGRSAEILHRAGSNRVAPRRNICDPSLDRSLRMHATVPGLSRCDGLPVAARPSARSMKGAWLRRVATARHASPGRRCSVDLERLTRLGKRFRAMATRAPERWRFRERVVQSPSGRPPSLAVLARVQERQFPALALVVLRSRFRREVIHRSLLKPLPLLCGCQSSPTQPRLRPAIAFGRPPLRWPPRSTNGHDRGSPSPRILPLLKDLGQDSVQQIIRESGSMPRSPRRLILEGRCARGSAHRPGFCLVRYTPSGARRAGTSRRSRRRPRRDEVFRRSSSEYSILVSQLLGARSDHR